MILPGVVSFAHTHRVVGEIHIAIVTFEVLVERSRGFAMGARRRNLQKSVWCQSKCLGEKGEEAAYI